MAKTEDISIGAIGDEDAKKQIESIVSQSNENFRLIANEDRTKIINDDSGTPRLLMGYHQDGFSNGSVGAKLSQEGVDVSVAADDELIWSTDFNSFKIVTTGTVTVTIPDVTTDSVVNIRINHNLGYAPVVIAFTENNGFRSPLPFMLGLGFTYPDMKFNGVIGFSVDDTVLNIYAVWAVSGSTPAISGSWDVRYYILKETAD